MPLTVTRRRCPRPRSTNFFDVIMLRSLRFALAEVRSALVGRQHQEGQTTHVQPGTLSPRSEVTLLPVPPVVAAFVQTQRSVERTALRIAHTSVRVVAQQERGLTSADPIGL
jgi:hypothetical protein